MPWYIPVILVPSSLVAIWFGFKSYRELVKGSDPLSVIPLGWFASDDHFTPRGRRYRLWSLASIGIGSLIIVLIRLLSHLR
jgi:hypothetical protein